MKRPTISKAGFIKAILWGIICFSSLALVYHIRWFIPFLNDSSTHIVPEGQEPLVWFIVQICNNIIFLLVGYLLIRLFAKYQQTGFFDKESLQVLKGVIISCIALGLLGAVQNITNNFNEVHINQWTSIEGILNLSFRTFTNLLLFREPQTMYFLLAIILWVVKQFVTKALFVKTENEAFI